MKNKSVVKELIEYKKKSGIRWRLIAVELDVDKSVLSRWIHGVNEPIEAHKNVIKKFLKNNS